MSVHVLDAMAREGFQELVALHHGRSDLRGFLGVHDTSRGPAFGGVRRWSYRNEREALIDCLRLARSMTFKCALAELPAGGAKLVVLDRPETDWQRAYEHLGDVVERMGGRFYTGPDVGTGEAELRWMAARTRYVTDPGPAGPGALAACTAEGVFHGMGAALRHLDGEEDWRARTVVVQGLGSVGGLLARRLVEHGATVLGAEIDEERGAQVAAETGFELIDPTSALGTPCDVYAPCALGGILHDLSVERLRCRAVVGGANNVLARALHGDRLHERGILYAPDLVVTSGALIRGAIFHLEGRTEPVEAIGRRVGETLAQLLERARRDGESPARVAARAAEERVAAGRGA